MIGMGTKNPVVIILSNRTQRRQIVGRTVCIPKLRIRSLRRLVAPLNSARLPWTSSTRASSAADQLRRRGVGGFDPIKTRTLLLALQLTRWMSYDHVLHQLLRNLPICLSTRDVFAVARTDDRPPVLRQTG